MMKTFLRKAVLIIGVFILAMALTVPQALAKKEWLGPVVEDCKEKKNGETKCKDKKLKGNKAIEFIYQELLANNSATAENAAAIAALYTEIQQAKDEIGDINIEIDGLEELIQDNADVIAETQANLNTTNTNLADLRAELTEALAALQGQIGDLQSQIDGLQTQITALTGALALQLQALQEAVDGNTANVDSLIIQVTSLTAQILLLNAEVIGPESRLTALEEELEQLQILVAQLDVRLISVESDSHTHPPTSCREILDKNASAASGTYQIDPDADGPIEPMDAYCDMDNFGGGWTNLNFSTNQVLLENGNLINCSTLSQDAISITCRAPLFNNGGYLYHYYCTGNDPFEPGSADYLIDHVGIIVGHRDSPTLGFSSLTQRHTGEHGSSENEYCYISGEVVGWSDARCAPYNQGGNGGCVPGFFTLRR